MALVPSYFRFLLTQRDFFAVARGGRALCLGVQDVHATHEQLAGMLRGAGLPVCAIPEPERRYTESRIVRCQDQYAHISDVFRMLGYEGVETIDFSEAESPDIIHNLNDPVPEALRERYDLVFDIGVIEHVCDIFQALCNCMAMVKPGGVAMHFVPLHGWHNMTYFNFQPMYLQEVYAANGFDPTRTFINFYPPYDEWRDRPQLYREYIYGDEMSFQVSGKLTNICFFARKSTSVDRFTKPIQGFYLRYHGEVGGESPPEELDGRPAARLKGQLPGWLRGPLVACNRFRLRLEERLLPMSFRERMWWIRHRRHLAALDRVRERKVYRI